MDSATFYTLNPLPTPASVTVPTTPDSPALNPNKRRLTGGLGSGGTVNGTVVRAFNFAKKSSAVAHVQFQSQSVPSSPTIISSFFSTTCSSSSRCSSLSAELLNEILTLLCPQTLVETCLVSRKWRAASLRVLYRDSSTVFCNGGDGVCVMKRVEKLVRTLGESQVMWSTAGTSMSGSNIQERLDVGRPLGWLVWRLDLNEVSFDHPGSLNILHQLIGLCTNLRVLKLNLNITIQTLSYLFSQCPQLSCLSVTLYPLEHGANDQTDITLTSLTPAAESPTNPNSLFSSSSSSTSAPKTTSLLTAPLRLRKLLIQVRTRPASTTNTTFAPAAAAAADTDEDVIDLFHTPPDLTFLPALLSVPTLTELHLSGIPASHAPLLPIGDTTQGLAPTLQVLRLTECASLDDVTLICALGGGGGQSGGGGKISSTARRRPLSDLRVLDLWGSQQVSDVFIQHHFGDGNDTYDKAAGVMLGGVLLPPPVELKRLQALDVTCTAVTEDGVAMVARAVAAAAEKAKRDAAASASAAVGVDGEEGGLHTVFMEGVECEGRKLIGIVEILGKGLRELVVGGCLMAAHDDGDHGVGGGGHVVAALPPTSTLSPHVDMPQLFNTTRASQPITTHALPLAPLPPPPQTTIDRLLISLSTYAPNLEQLDITGCGDHISKAAIEAVVKGCPLLRTFVVDETAVDASVLSMLRERYEIDGVFLSSFWAVDF